MTEWNRTQWVPDVSVDALGLCCAGIDAGSWHGTTDFLVNAPWPDGQLEPLSWEDITAKVDTIVQVMREADLSTPLRFGESARLINVHNAPGWAVNGNYVAYVEAIVGYGGTWCWAEVQLPTRQKWDQVPTAIYVRDGEVRGFVLGYRLLEDER